MRKKSLIYSTVALSAHYAMCLRVLLRSLTTYSSVFDFEFLVMCDSKTEATVREISTEILFPVHLWRIPDADTPPAASMQKLTVFSWPDIGNFHKILFLDADILVGLDIDALLAEPLRDDALFVFRETTDLELHKHIYFSLYDAEQRCTYAEADLQSFAERKIFPFNAGAFLMLNTPVMKAHFDQILQRVVRHVGYYFYEQSFLNDHFNRLGKADYSLITGDNYVIHPDINRLYAGKIIHFTINVGDGQSKADVMQNYVSRFFAGSLPFGTREDMLEKYVMPGAVIAELGTFRGDFAQFLLNLRPDKLYLVDLFAGTVGSGDVDGNGFESYDGEELHRYVSDRFSMDSYVEVVKGDTVGFLSKLPDQSLDVIYIDADHSYAACSADLELARRKVKKGGLIVGHDYEPNLEKATVMYEFGVKRAVDDFCARHGVKIIARGMDGYVSYCIMND